MSDNKLAPVANALLPCACCKNKLKRKTSPKMTKLNMNPAPFNFQNRTLRESTAGMTGCGALRSRMSTPKNVSTASAPDPRIHSDSQPIAGPSISAKLNPASPAMISACVAISNRRTVVDDGLMTSWVRKTPVNPTGRFRKKMLRHPKYWTSNPPMNGPEPAATPMIAPQIPTIRVRVALSGNASANKLSELGMKSAAPAPCNKRAITSMAVDADSPHSPEATTNQSSPTM